MVDSMDCLTLEDELPEPTNVEPKATAEPSRASALDLGAELLDAFGLGLTAAPRAPEVLVGLKDLVRAGRPRCAELPGAESPDEATEAVAALEGLWQASRRDTAKRLMRASTSDAPHLLRLEPEPPQAIPHGLRSDFSGGEVMKVRGNG